MMWWLFIGFVCLWLLGLLVEVFSALFGKTDDSMRNRLDARRQQWRGL